MDVTATLTVDRLHGRYAAASPADADRLDACLRLVVVDQLDGELLGRVLHAADHVCVPEVTVPVVLDARAPVALGARRWARAIVDSLDGALVAGDGVVVYPRTLDALVDLVVSVGRGTLDRTWAWRQVGLLGAAGGPATPAAVAAALAGRAEEAPAALAAAAARGPIPLTSDGWVAVGGAVRALVAPAPLPPGPTTPGGRVDADPPDDRGAPGDGALAAWIARQPVSRRLPAAESADDDRSALATLAVTCSAPVRARSRPLVAAVARALAAGQPGAAAAPPDPGAGPHPGAGPDLDGPAPDPGPWPDPDGAAARAPVPAPAWAPATVPAPANVPAAVTDDPDPAPPATCAPLADPAGEPAVAGSAALPADPARGPDDGAPGPAEVPAGAPDPDVAPTPPPATPPPSAATEFGGVLLLVPALTALDLPARLAEPPSPLAIRPWARAAAELAHRLTDAEPDDPAVTALTAPPAAAPSRGNGERSEQPEATAHGSGGLLPRARSNVRHCLTDAEEEALGEAVGEVDRWLRGRLRAAADEDLGWLWRRRATLAVEPGWVEATFSLDDVDTRVRLAGLDLDPGFVWWLGAVVRFRYV